MVSLCVYTLSSADSISTDDYIVPLLACSPATQVSAASSFTTDLGLDSLDAVEVVMAIEEEFTIVSIPIESRCHSAKLLLLLTFSSLSCCDSTGDSR